MIDNSDSSGLFIFNNNVLCENVNGESEQLFK